MRILSGNVHVGHLPWVDYGLLGSPRLARLIRLLRAQRADVVALQEVHDPRVARFIQLALPTYTWAYSPSSPWRLRWLWIPMLVGLAYWLLGLAGLLLLAWARDTGVGQFVWWGNPGLLLGWRSDLASTATYQSYHHQQGDWHNRFAPRGYQQLELSDRTAIINTHLDADGGRQSDQVGELSWSRSGIIVVAGDLNVPYTNLAVQLLVGAGFRAGSCTLPTWTSYNDWLYRWLYGPLPSMRLDYVLVRGQDAHWETIPTSGASDHSFVAATLA